MILTVEIIVNETPYNMYDHENFYDSYLSTYLKLIYIKIFILSNTIQTAFFLGIFTSCKYHTSCGQEKCVKKLPDE